VNLIKTARLLSVQATTNMVTATPPSLGRASQTDSKYYIGAHYHHMSYWHWSSVPSWSVA